MIIYLILYIIYNLFSFNFNNDENNFYLILFYIIKFL